MRPFAPVMMLVAGKFLSSCAFFRGDSGSKFDIFRCKKRNNIMFCQLHNYLDRV
jgi:hypothetical protein